MAASPDPMQTWSWPLMAASLSVLLTEAGIAYSRRRALLDQPERRRVHRVPTPRGGGVGIVAASVLALVLLGLAVPTRQAFVAAAGVGLILVAAIGWWDDHRPLPAWPKFVVHLIAAGLLIAALGAEFSVRLGGHVDAMTLAFELAVGAILACLCVWSINLHNFMDGINGLLAWQSVFVFGALALFGVGGYHAREHMAFLYALAAAALAFVPFNFPRARVFMGDVGSGALGFLMIGALLVSDPLALLVWAILDSAFVMDATATLLIRVLGRRRWYSAHREHLYQWLVRCGFSHPRVVGLYALWNLCIALPCAVLFVMAPRWWPPAVDPSSKAIVVAMPPLWLIPIVYALAAVVWLAAKRWCLRHVRARGVRHAVA